MQDIQLGRYRLLKLLATGGMGEVFLARHEGPAGFTKTLVVKRMLAHLGRDPNFVEMFLNEARLAARLSHPNVTQIFELGEQDGIYFLAMEFVHGVDLHSIRRHLEDRNVEVPAELAAWICAQALKGLHYAHTLQDEHGAALHIVHRDVSPDNVLVDFNATVKVVDFGIAKASTSIRTTGAGTVKGKFSYMAPELLTGQPATPRTDIYAMGVVLYEFLSGGRPFQAPSEGALVTSILEGVPRPLRALRPDLPAELEEIVHRAISKNPQERFRTAESMSAALEAFVLASGGMAQDGVKELLHGLFGDEPEFISQVTPAPGPHLPRPSPKPPTKRDRTVALPVPARPLLARWWKLASPWLWMGVGAALTIAAAGWMLPVLRGSPPSRAQALAQESPRSQRIPTGVLASALVIPTELTMTGGSPEAVPPSGGATVAGPAGAPVPEPTPPRATAASKVGRGASRGTVVLRASSGVEVIHRGKTLGVTPLGSIQLPSGAQTLTLVNRRLGVEKKVRVVVPARRKVVVRVDMNQ